MRGSVHTQYQNTGTVMYKKHYHEHASSQLTNELPSDLALLTYYIVHALPPARVQGWVRSGRSGSEVLDPRQLDPVDLACLACRYQGREGPTACITTHASASAVSAYLAA